MCEFANSDMFRDKLTVAEAITIATQVESASEQAKTMASDQHLPIHVVKTHDTAHRPRQPRRSYSTKPANKPDSTSSARACFHCGSENTWPTHVNVQQPKQPAETAIKKDTLHVRSVKKLSHLGGTRSRAAAPLRGKEPVEVVRASNEDATRAPS